MSTELSAELLELVVDILADDKPSLRQCALASSVLRRRARHHLFSAVSLYSHRRASVLVNLLDADPALGGCVASLAASPENHTQRWLVAPARTGLPALLPHFPHLTALVLRSIWCYPNEAGPIAAALPASLRRLELRGCRFASNADIVALFTAAPRLRHVVVEFCEVALEAHGRDSYLPTVELEELVVVPRWGAVHIGNGGPAATWLAVVSSRTLVSLTVALGFDSDVPFWQTRIDQAGSVMRQLEIKCRDLSCAPTTFHTSLDRPLISNSCSGVHIDLSPLTTVHTLIITLHSSYDRRVGPGKITVPLIRALETTTSSSLELAKLKFECVSTADLSSVDWHALRVACDVVRTRAPRFRVMFEIPDYMLTIEPKREVYERTLREAIVSHNLEGLVDVELVPEL
jgi:hypothetical protein